MMRVDMQTVKPDVRDCGEYLGFAMAGCDIGYFAVPRAWKGTVVLDAPSEPELRKLIWRWWYLVGWRGGTA